MLVLHLSRHEKIVLKNKETGEVYATISRVPSRLGGNKISFNAPKSVLIVREKLNDKKKISNT